MQVCYAAALTWVQDSDKARTRTIEDGKGPSLVGGVEHRGFEPLTYCLQSNRATNCANAPMDPDILCQDDADAKWGWWIARRGDDPAGGLR